MTPDSRWLEILKASGWQTAAIAFACGVIYLFIHNGLLPLPGDWTTFIIAALGIVCGCLAVSSILSSALRFFPIGRLFGLWWQRRQTAYATEKYIPFMSKKERQIIAWLLYNNRKTFTVEIDGGYANTLISQKIVVKNLCSGQHYRESDMPVAIPDHVWEVLVKHKSQFPYSPDDDEKGGHPWRIPWNVR